MTDTLTSFFEALHRTLEEAKIYRLMMVVVVLVILGGIGLWIFEPQVDMGNALWWSIVTLTTVGYGDISPATVGGRLIGVVLMVLGIGVLGAFTAQVASLLFERKRLRAKGLIMHTRLTDHLILSGWSSHARAVLDDVRSDGRGKELPIVLIAELDEAPVLDDHLYFIHGKTNEATLEKANLQDARTVIIFGDPSLDEEASDAKVVLHALTVEDINPNVYTIVELAQSTNRSYCERAHADEVIVGNEFSSRLLSRAALDHGISKVLSELVSPRYGKEIYKVPLGERLVGETFETTLQEVKRSHDCLVVGIEEQVDGVPPRVITNPPASRVMQATDTLIVIGDASTHALSLSKP